MRRKTWRVNYLQHENIKELKTTFAKTWYTREKKKTFAIISLTRELV